MRLVLAALLVLLACAPVPAHAQLGATLSLVNDYRFRGYSLSEGKPALTLDLSYDSPSGFYAGASGSAVVGPKFVQLLSIEESAGYAARIGGGATLDVGISNFNYSYGHSARSSGYTQVYVGLVGKGIASHVYFSPNYFRSDARILYFDLSGSARPAADWRLFGHVGLLTQVGGPAVASLRRTQHDWRAGVARELGAIELQLALSGGGPGRDFYEGRSHSRTALVGRIAWSF